jgi:predicted O-methyltransferase YrrM/uncharacterized damage-inducible protein DinB
MEPPTPNQDLWNAVDHALEAWLAPQDAALIASTSAATAAGLPKIAVAPAQGRLLEVLARAIGARRILEVGTLAGYSAIWLARALPADGMLVTLELDPARAELARENIARARVAPRVDVIAGSATASLEALRTTGTPPFDLVFIDANREQCAVYLEHALALSRPGTVIIVDNAIHRGRVIEEGTGDASVEGVRAMMAAIARDPRLAAAGVQTVGAKGYDGFVMLVVGESAATTAPPAQPSDTLNSMLAHDAWATREVLRACAALDDGAWHRAFEIGPGSLHDTLTHIVGAMFRWADRIDGPPRQVRPSIEDGTRRTPAELLALLDLAAADLAASAARARHRGLATKLDVTLGGTAYRFTLGGMLAHVATHGAHHRAQCLNMLRRLELAGVSDQLPEIDFLEWELSSRR